MRILSLREHPEMLEQFITYFSSHWRHEELYRDCMTAALSADSPLPQWFLAVTPEGGFAGGAGLIPNDFISRMDLCPWLCALYVEEKFCGQGLGGRVIRHVAESARTLGFSCLYCCTDHIGFYEHYEFRYIGTGFHPWGETSRIYGRIL